MKKYDGRKYLEFKPCICSLENKEGCQERQPSNYRI
jgi:hypothetical protein